MNAIIILLAAVLGLGGVVGLMAFVSLWLLSFPRSKEKEDAIRRIRENGELTRHAMDEVLVHYQQAIEGMIGGTDGNQ